jgi:hypothetical protein
MERAIGEELKNTPTVISKTGLFDQLDKLYGNKPGEGAPQAPPGETSEPAVAAFGGGGFDAGADLGADLSGDLTGETPDLGATTPEEGEITPESTQNKDMNILIETGLYGNQFLNLGIAQQSLGKIEDELDKLLNS